MLIFAVFWTNMKKNNQPGMKKQVVDQIKTQGLTLMYKESSEKFWGSDSFSIFLKNSSYLLQKQRFLTIFGSFLATFWRKTVAGKPEGTGRPNKNSGPPI